MKEKILQLIDNHIAGAEDNAACARMQFGRLSTDELDKPYGQSGRKCKEVLESAERAWQDALDMKAWLMAKNGGGLYKSDRRGSIALARQLCAEIAGEPYPDDWEGDGYGSVDVAEILSAEVERLRNAINKTLDENAHLADGEICTLICLKVALRESGSPWHGDV